MRHVTSSASLTNGLQPWRRRQCRLSPLSLHTFAAAALLLLLAPPPAAADAAEDAAEALERELLISFRATVPCWHRLQHAANLSGLHGWHPAAQLHHCQWDGVACCTIHRKLSADEGPVLRRRAVCSVRLAAAAAGAAPAAAAAAAQGGAPAGPPASPGVVCDGGGAAAIAPLLGLEWLQELSLDGIPVSPASLAGLLGSPPRGERLWILSLRRAALQIPLPPRLLELPQLRVLDLSHSGISGPLPPSRPCSLEEINLAGNPVTGSIPATWLADCLIRGDRERPAFFSPLFLNLSRSGVSGQLPQLPLVGADRVGSSHLGVLDVSHTAVGGTLPQTWGGNSPHVRLLDLSHARFRGTIPGSWWATPHLLRFQAVEQEPGANPTSLTLLQGNQLHGTVTLAQAAALVNWTDAEDVKGLDRERQRTVADLENAVLRHQPLEGMGPYMLHAGRRDLRLHAMLLARGSHAALWPGNQGLCVEMGGELTWGRLEAARYPELQEHACGGGPHSAAGARTLSLVLPLAAAAASAAAVLACLAAASKLRQRRRKRGYSSVPADVGGTERSSAEGEASQALPRPRRELELAARAVERAQVGGSRAQGASRLGAAASQASQPPDSLGSGGADDVAAPLVGGEDPLMPPLLPISSLSFPRHGGQPLALGASGATKVMLGRLEGVGEVAVKALHVSPQQLEPARREVALLKRCANRSPHVVAVHGLCYAHPFLLVVTELCGGGDLQSVLHMPELRWHALGARVALDVARGVAFMHSQGVVWADCKPGNVLLTAGFRAKVTDLGASRLLRGHSTAQVAATQAYAAPEQLLNGRVSLASDVFSLGLVIQDICSGEPPAGPGQQRRALLPGVDCPAAVARLLGRCLTRNPAQRPTAEEVAEALQQHVPGGSGGDGLLDAAPD